MKKNLINDINKVASNGIASQPIPHILLNLIHPLN